MKYYLTAISAVLFFSAAIAETQPHAGKDSNVQVTLASEVDWTFLNPKRGALAPMAGTLWGDRNAAGATGFLLKPSDGFESPPHIHNVSYRGIVIRGAIHNDDPDAANMWMPPGSFWTQPKGHVHITAATGKGSLAYIEIEEGPYHVLPEDEAFDSGERPVNVDQSNIVWLGKSDLTWVDSGENPGDADAPKIAFLWGKTEAGELNGTFIKLPAGFKGSIRSDGESFRAVVIQGQLDYRHPSVQEPKTLDPGSHFSAEGKTLHQLDSSPEEESILYVRTNGKYHLIPSPRAM
ncbi:DUF4437 domain-containing protein [Haloferula chungangensis]|uniref:DUF4437 domain-containing protein n=1 Tax=Haloferula chungangensis TaxID=1048331 RepID=A0ABW2L5Z9_9BACT